MLLFDQNVSSRILKLIEFDFPGSTHVVREGMQDAADSVIFDYAGQNNLAVVTFDSDFVDLSMVRGHPPKIIWLRIRNQTTENIAVILRANRSSIDYFLKSEQSDVLEISPPEGENML